MRVSLPEIDEDERTNLALAANCRWVRGGVSLADNACTCGNCRMERALYQEVLDAIAAATGADVAAAG